MPGRSFSFDSGQAERQARRSRDRETRRDLIFVVHVQNRGIHGKSALVRDVPFDQIARLQNELAIGSFVRLADMIVGAAELDRFEFQMDERGCNGACRGRENSNRRSPWAAPSI